MQSRVLNVSAYPLLRGYPADLPNCKVQLGSPEVSKAWQHGREEQNSLMKKQLAGSMLDIAVRPEGL